jgi:uncharacterized repeat protein (TIGR03803 family)
MTNPGQHRSHISQTILPRTALAVMVSLVILAPSAHAQFKTLYTFTGGTDGGQPSARVISGLDGSLYGTAPFGGDLSCNFGQGCGVVYKLTKAGKESVLYAFPGGANGASPYSALIVDAQGNFYGTATSSGACSNTACGLVFKISPQGKETVLYTFTGSGDGGGPSSALVMDSAGNLYGTTAFGGAPNVGVVYKVSPAGQETVLYSFRGAADGAYPNIDRLAVDSSGNFYGVTSAAGDLTCNGSLGCGTVFQLTPAGAFTVLYAFTNGSDGSIPSGLALDAEGNLYGTTETGGAFNDGVLFQISNVGGTNQTFTTLHSFGPSKSVFIPLGNVTVCTDGNVYGISQGGGSAAWGTLWKVDQAGNESVVHNFNFVPGGGHPSASPQWAQGDDGAVFYGTAPEGGSNNNGRGVVYRMDVDSQQQKCAP